MPTGTPTCTYWCPQRALDGGQVQLSDGKSADILANSSKGHRADAPRSCSNPSAQLPEPGSGPGLLPMRFHAFSPAIRGRAFVERLMKKPAGQLCADDLP